MSKVPLNKKTFSLQTGVAFAALVSIIYYTASFISIKNNLENDIENCHTGIDHLADDRNKAWERIDSLEEKSHSIDLHYTEINTKLKAIEEAVKNNH